MRAGELNQRIVRYAKTRTRDNMGGEVVTYVAAETLKAKAEPIRGREYTALQQSESEMEVRFTVRFREGITPDDRFEWRDTTYELVSPPIDVLAKRTWVELMCRTVQSE